MEIQSKKDLKLKDIKPINVEMEDLEHTIHCINVLLGDKSFKTTKLARDIGIDHGYISRLRSGQRSMDNMRIGTYLKFTKYIKNYQKELI